MLLVPRISSYYCTALSPRRRETRINTRRRTLLPSFPLPSSPFRLLIHPPIANDVYIYIYVPSFERAFLTVKIKNGRDIIEAFVRVTVLSPSPADKFFPIGFIDRIRPVFRHPKVTNYTVNFPTFRYRPCTKGAGMHSTRFQGGYLRNCTPDPWQKRQSAPGPVGIVARSVPPLEMYLAPETMYPEPCISSPLYPGPYG